MNALTTTHGNLPSAVDYTTTQVRLIKDTVARDCNPLEFDLFMTVAKRARLDPFRRQIMALVFNKDKPDKRNMAIVTGIDGLRTIAARSRRYRPDEQPPRFEFDETLKGPLNPLGLVRATVTIFNADDWGKWWPVAGTAKWEEFAPIKDDWAENDAGKWRPTGKQTLDTGGNWGKMPEVMLAKCAEAQALRRAFPEDTSGLYEYAELDRARVVDLTPSEVIEQANVENRLERIGGTNAIIFQLSPTSPLEHIALGKITDTIMAASRDWDLNLIRWFESSNRVGLREFYSRSPTDALALKKHLEDLHAKLEKAAEAAPVG